MNATKKMIIDFRVCLDVEHTPKSYADVCKLEQLLKDLFLDNIDLPSELKGVSVKAMPSWGEVLHVDTNPLPNLIATIGEHRARNYLEDGLDAHWKHCGESNINNPEMLVGIKTEGMNPTEG